MCAHSLHFTYETSDFLARDNVTPCLKDGEPIWYRSWFHLTCLHTMLCCANYLFHIRCFNCDISRKVKAFQGGCTILLNRLSKEVWDVMIFIAPGNLFIKPFASRKNRFDFFNVIHGNFVYWNEMIKCFLYRDPEKKHPKIRDLNSSHFVLSLMSISAAHPALLQSSSTISPVLSLSK